MVMSPARPPTTPPAIAPTLLLFEPPDEVPVLEGRMRVAVRVTDEAPRVKYTAKSGLSQEVGAVLVAPPVGLEVVSHITLYPMT